MMKRLRTGLKALSFVYPLLLWLLRDEPYFLACALPFMALLFVDFLLRAGWPLRILGVGLVGIVFLALHDPDSILRIYPFLISLSVLHLFWQTKDPGDNPMIGPLRKHVQADPELLGTLHEAKRIWIVGLSLNTLILAVLIFAFSFETWALYANLYSYLFLLALFVLSVLYVAWKRRVILYLYSFAFFAFICLLFVPIALPSALAPQSLRRRLEPLARRIAHQVFAFVRWHCRLSGFATMRLIDHRQGSQSRLWIANHLSMFDIVLLFSFVPGIQTLVNAKFFANPLLWPLIRATGYIPLRVDRPADGVRAFTELEECLSRGQTVVIFPEGTRSADGRLGPMKKGPFRLATDHGIQPNFVFFTCNQPFLNRAAFFPKKAGPVILEAHLYAAPAASEGDSWLSVFLEEYKKFTGSRDALAWNRAEGLR